MKYRIRKETRNDRVGYRAEIWKDTDWVPVEEDNNYLCSSCKLHKTIEEAEQACRKHHEEMEYVKKEDIIKEFEL